MGPTRQEVDRGINYAKQATNTSKRLIRTLKRVQAELVNFEEPNLDMKSGDEGFSAGREKPSSRAAEGLMPALSLLSWGDYRLFCAANR